MLAVFRRFANSWVSKALITLLVISFGFFGLQGYFSGRPNADAVVSAGDRKVTEGDFRQQFDNFKKMAEQQAGQPLTAEVAAQNGLDKRLLEQVATQEGMLAFLHKIGIRPSDQLVAGELKKIEGFFSPVTGKFDKELYAQKLAENGLTPTKFDQLLQGEIAQNHLAAALEGGMQTPRAYGALAAIYAMEGRNVGYFAVPMTSVAAVTPPTDTQLAAFMKENQAVLMQPEFRIITLARFSPAMTAGSVKIDEAELQKRYQFRKDTLSKPETRSLVQIPAKDAAAAAQIIARLGKGDLPEAIAKSLGVDVINYTDKPRSAIPDRGVGEAAFKLAEGQVSAPIKGDLGLAVVRVSKITAGVTPSLEQIRGELEAELRKDAAGEKVYAMTQAYEDAHSGGASLAEAAAKSGAALMTLPPLSKEGATPDRQPMQGLPPRILEIAYGLPAGGESEIEELGNGEYFALRVEKIIPTALPPMEQVKGELTQVWMGRELMKRMHERAAVLSERLRKGETLEAVAGAAGSSVTRIVALDRVNAARNKDLPQELAGKAFAAKPGEVFTADDPHLGVLIGKVESVAIHPGPDLVRLTEAARPQLSQAVLQEISKSAATAARSEMKVKTNYALARSAIGLEPLDEPKKGKKK